MRNLRCPGYLKLILSAVFLTSTLASSAATLIDVAFTSSRVTAETGFAATGVTSNDFWNTYVENSGTLSNLYFVDGTISGAELLFTNAEQALLNGVSDPMYGVSLYPLDSGSLNLTITNLVAGTYNFYLYGHGNGNTQNSVFQLSTGPLSYGSEATTNGPGWNTTVWQEGVQYVEFTNVNVDAGGTVTIAVGPGAGGTIVISGLQMANVGPPSPVAAVLGQPQYQEIVQGVTTTFNAVAGGAAPITYQWLFNNAIITGATNTSYTVVYAQPTNTGTYSVIVSNASGSVTGNVATLAVVVPPASLIDIDFYSYAVTPKTGLAATGITTGDFWNTYSVNSSLLTNLNFADGTTSGAGVTVSNAGTSSENGASDPMYGTYLFSASYDDITVTLTNVAAGTYDFYLYGHGDTDIQYSTFQLSVAAQSFGSEATTNGPGWLSSEWQEGVQYVEFTNVVVGKGQTITITVEPEGSSITGGSPFAFLSGLQLAAIGQVGGPSAFIFSQPIRQEILQGSPASFNVVAGGLPPLRYQWVFDNVEIPGATNSSYSVINAQPTNAGNYSVLVSNTYGSVTSAVAPLIVDVPPQKLIDVAFTGSSVTPKTGFAATGITTNDFWNTYDINVGNLTNMEFVDGTASGAALLLNAPYASANVNGAFDPMYGTYVARLDAPMTLTITNLPPDAYDFYLYGHGQVVGSSGWQPDDQSSIFQVTAGSQSFGLMGTLEGHGWLSPVWQEGVQYVKLTNVSISVGEAVTITIYGGYVYSVISGLQIASVNPANQIPFIITQPANQSVLLNSNVVFSLQIGGTAPLMYQWQFNNANISGATNSTYSLNNAQPANIGNYSVIVTNAYGSVTSTVAALNVITQATSLIDVAFTGATVTAETGFAATGITSNDFWNTDNGAPLADLEFVNGTASGAGLTIANIGGAASNGESDPMYGNYLFGNANIIVTVTNLPAATYDFYIFGHGNGNNQNCIYQLYVSSAGQGSEATTNGPGWLSEAWQEGVQYVEFTNVSVVAGQTVSITVLPGAGGFDAISGLQMAAVGPPSPVATIITQPTNLLLYPGSNATFSVLAGGSPPYTYQWLFDNAIIPGATNSSFTVTNAQRTNLGGYSVVVSNSFSSVTSVVAALNLFESAGPLMNVDFTAGTVSSKTGFAATGLTTNDFWNALPAAIFETPLSSLTNLEFSDGTISQIGLTAFMWDYSTVGFNGASDPMYGTYQYPSFLAGNITVQVTNLSPGIYNFYLYGHGASNNQNCVFSVSVGSQGYGIQSTSTNPFLWLSPVWQNGGQYVEFINVAVLPEQTVSIIDNPATAPYSVISGLQIEAAGPPLVLSVSNLAVNVNQSIIITNQAYSVNGPLSFTLASNAPAGATISSNGVFSWSPSCAEGSTTNLITVWATDSESPPQSNSVTFAVTVNECVEVSVGSSAQQIGQSTCVPLSLFSTVPLSNFNFTLSDPTGHLTNWNVNPTNSLIGSATAQMPDPLHAVFNFGAQNGQVLQGSNSIGSICLDILPGPSAFVPLVPSNMGATDSNNSPVTFFAEQAGRVVVIGSQSLLDISLDTNSIPSLTLYGNPGVTYNLFTTTNPVSGGPWDAFGSVTLSNLFQVIDIGGATNQMQLFEAVQP